MKIKISKERAEEIYDEILDNFSVINLSADLEKIERVKEIVNAISLGILEHDAQNSKIIHNLVSKIESGNLSGDNAIARLEYTGSIPAYERKAIAMDNNEVNVGIRAISCLSQKPEKIIGKLQKTDWDVACEVAKLFL